jgi:hypothetical protein
MNYDIKFPTAAPVPTTEDHELARLGRMLDCFFNTPGQPPVRFVLMLPDGGNCRFISNGVGRLDLMRLFHDQVRQFLDGVQDRPRPQMPDTSNVTSLLNPEVIA